MILCTPSGRIGRSFGQSWHEVAELLLLFADHFPAMQGSQRTAPRYPTYFPASQVLHSVFTPFCVEDSFYGIENGTMFLHKASVTPRAAYAGTSPQLKSTHNKITFVIAILRL